MMRKKTLLFLFLILAAAISSAFPQDEEDTTQVDREFWKDHTFKFDLFQDNFKGQPTVTFMYGFSSLGLKNLPESPSKPNLLEFKIGYSGEKETDENENIIYYKYRFGYLTYSATKLSGKNSSNDFKDEMWRFGLGRAFGYGYKIGSISVIPYHAYSVDWSRLAFTNMPADSLEQKLLSPFSNTFRFGTSTEGGIKLKLLPELTIDGAYERSMIFPRHLFWKWAGSVIIEAGGQIALDNFIEEILDSSPYAAPVMSFILKNALSFGMYELRRSKMNWPFSTVAPFTHDQFKMGVTLTF